MNRVSLKLLTGLCLLLCLPGCGGGFSINAVQGARPRGLSFRPRAMTPEATFARYDSNFDAKLAATEAEATCLTEAGIAFDQYDDDSDGQISFSELLQHPECPCSQDPSDQN